MNLAENFVPFGAWRVIRNASSDWLPVDQYVITVADVIAALTLASWLKIATAVALVFVFYYYVVVPANWVRDLSEVGYDFLLDGGVGSAQRRGKSRRELVQEVRNLRKIGKLPPVYPNGWFVVLESDELGAGQVKHVAALGENFAVFRTTAGVVHILDAYCPHLGANMGIGGTVRGDCLECPFHGWRFRGEDGKCSSVPYSDKIPDVARVKRWESCEENSFIFVWYHAEGEAPNWRPAPVENIRNKKWIFRGRNEFLINCHIQEIPENGGDVAHLAAVHGPSILNGSDLRFCQRLLWSFTRHEWAAQWAPNDAPGQTHTATMTLSHEVQLFNKIALVRMNVRAEQIGPGYVELHMESSLGKMAFVQSVTPLEPLVQRVIHRLYMPPMWSLFSNALILGESIMIERDIMVWNHKKYVEKPLLVKEDKTIARHRRWYNQFYSENSPRFSFQRESLDW